MSVSDVKMAEEEGLDIEKLTKSIRKFGESNADAAGAADRLGFSEVSGMIMADRKKVWERIISLMDEISARATAGVPDFRERLEDAIRLIDTMQESLSDKDKKELKEDLKQARANLKQLKSEEEKRRKGEDSKAEEVLREIEKISAEILEDMDESDGSPGSKIGGGSAAAPENVVKAQEPPATAGAGRRNSSSTEGIEAVYTTPSEEQEEHPPEDTRYTRDEAPAKHEADEEEESVEDKINNGIFVILTTADGLEKAGTEAELKGARDRFRKAVATIKDSIGRLLSASRGEGLEMTSSAVKKVLDDKAEEIDRKIKGVPGNKQLRRKILRDEERPPGPEGRRLFRLVMIYQELLDLRGFVEKESARLS